MNFLKWQWMELRLSGARGFFLYGIVFLAVALWAFSELFLVHQFEFGAVCLMGLGGLALEFEIKARDEVKAFNQSF
jgi:hypothetical protein